MADSIAGAGLSRAQQGDLQSRGQNDSVQNQPTTVREIQNTTSEVTSEAKQGQDFQAHLNKSEITHVEGQAKTKIFSAADLVDGQSVYSNPDNRV